MKRLTLLFITITALLLNTANSQDQKAVKILESMQEEYEQSIENIDDYIMEKGDHTIYYKKATTDDGRPYFKTKIKGEYWEDLESASATNEDFYSEFSQQAKEKATYKGTDEIDGNEVHVINIDQMEVEGYNPDKDTENAIENIFLYIDSDKLVIRRMEYSVESEVQDGEVREISPVIKNSDFRNVEGMLIPYKTVTVVEGLTLSEEEQKQAKEGLKEFEEMSESQKEMAGNMMGDKIEEYRKMVENNRYEKVSKVEKIEVNTGMEDF